MTASDGKLLTFRDVIQQRDKRVMVQEPIDTTESFIKFDQSWPINKSKDQKESPAEKKQKLSGNDETREAALAKVQEETFSNEKYLRTQLTDRKDLNKDTRIYTFKHPLKSAKEFNVGIGQHILCGFMLKDGLVERPYAILRPIGADKDDGTIDILVKTALPSEKDPGGTVTNILDSLKSDRSDEMLIRGPEGPIVYNGNGKFTIDVEGKKKVVNCKKINFISGGSGSVVL